MLVGRANRLFMFRAIGDRQACQTSYAKLQSTVKMRRRLRGKCVPSGFWQSVVQMLRVFGQIIRQALDGPLLFRSLFGRQGGAHVLADSEPTIRQQSMPALIQPGLRLGSAVAEEGFGGTRDVRAGVVNVQEA